MESLKYFQENIKLNCSLFFIIFLHERAVGPVSEKKVKRKKLVKNNFTFSRENEKNHWVEEEGGGGE